MSIVVDSIKRHLADYREAKARRRLADMAAEAMLDRPAWSGAKHSARTELAWLSASGKRVGPGHPWWEVAHRKKPEDDSNGLRPEG